jgi:hypothetical protein
MEPTWADVAQTAILGGQLLVLAVAAAVAWRQVREARRLREQQIRPFVVIDIEVDRFLFFLAVSNVGTTLARDVRFEIDPPLDSAIENALNEMKMFRHGIATLPPNKAIRTLFDSALQRKPADLPDLYTVRVRYRDQTGRRTFDETFDLDLGVYWNLTTVERRDVHDLHERLKEIRNEMRKWTAGSRGLLRISPRERRAEDRRTRRLSGRGRKGRLMRRAAGWRRFLA